MEQQKQIILSEQGRKSSFAGYHILMNRPIYDFSTRRNIETIIKKGNFNDCAATRGL